VLLAQTQWHPSRNRDSRDVCSIRH
jgi:hypothetical protein